MPPKYPVEEGHLRFLPRDIERIRREIVNSSLEGLATHLGGIKQSRKTVIFVSEGFTQLVDDVRELYQAANRANVAFYPIDPRGLTMSSGRTTGGQMMNGQVSDGTRWKRWPPEFKRGENTIASSPTLAAVPRAVQAAVVELADSLRPDADVPAEGRRRAIMPKAVDATVPPLTIGVARGLPPRSTADRSAPDPGCRDARVAPGPRQSGSG